MAESVLIEGGEVLGAEGVLRRSDVLIHDGVIAAVGRGAGADAGDVPRLDAQGMIVAPGLINAHMHSGENFNPGLYENLPLDLWFVRSHQVTRAEPPSRDAIYARTLLGAVLMLRSGTTAAVDFLFEAPEITLETLEPVVQAYRDAGLRATILLGVADKPYSESLPLDDPNAAAAHEAPPPSLERIMELARAAVDRWHDPDGLIGIGLGPSAPQRCTPELMDATMALARERGLAWQTHVLETRSQAVTCREWHGRTFIEELRDRGLLGRQATLVHTVWLTDDDIAIMRDTGTTAAHCLMSNLRLGDGIARLPALIEAGVNVALGTDGRGCDESLDMLELAKMTALVHKARGGDFRRWPTAPETLHMATAGGSRCTGHGERLGRVAPGAHGDLILLPRASAAFTPMLDPVRQLVFSASSRDIHTVVVDGRVVVRDGRVTGVDEEALIAGAAKHAEDVLSGEKRADADLIEAMVERMYDRTEQAPLDVDAYLPR
jgi:5-methylthioadenosine/S-adenosylhomocysteine deaminase